MIEEKLETMNNLFEGSTIRSIWDSEKEDYYFSVVDVIAALTNSTNSGAYWRKLKQRLNEEGSELVTICHSLKIKAKDGKLRNTDVLDTKGILRLIESVPSPKAEPFKIWLANLGSDRIDEIFDPEIAIKRAISYYQKKGYTNDWIEARLKSILKRNELTDTWASLGIKESFEFAALTNEIYHEWSGMTASEYKDFKGIRKESLRDNMSELEVLLTDIGETATKALAKKHHPKGLKENKDIAKKGGNIAKITKDNLEKELNEKIITSNNNLNIKYVDNNKLINKEKSL